MIILLLLFLGVSASASEASDNPTFINIWIESKYIVFHRFEECSFYYSHSTEHFVFYYNRNDRRWELGTDVFVTMNCSLVFNSLSKIEFYGNNGQSIQIRYNNYEWSKNPEVGEIQIIEEFHSKHSRNFNRYNYKHENCVGKAKEMYKEELQEACYLLIAAFKQKSHEQCIFQIFQQNSGSKFQSISDPVYLRDRNCNSLPTDNPFFKPPPDIFKDICLPVIIIMTTLLMVMMIMMIMWICCKKCCNRNNVTEVNTNDPEDYYTVTENYNENYDNQKYDDEYEIEDNESYNNQRYDNEYEEDEF